MSNNFQECSHLLIEDGYKSSKDTLGDIFNLQRTIQTDVYKYDFDELMNNNSKLLEFWKWNNIAIQSEVMEAFDALGGIKDGVGNAAWKPWKGKNKDFLSGKLSDLTPSDLKELKMELIDIQHFLFNLMLSVGMTSEEIYNFYLAKNKENINRQANNY